MADLKVVPFKYSASLRDIPGCLRKLADEIEARAGEENELLTLVYVKYTEDGSVQLGAFGDNPSKAEVVGLLTLAAGKLTAKPGELTRS